MSKETREVKRNNRIRVAKYIFNSGSTSKVEIASELQLSMPTTLSNVNSLIESGIAVESGEYESTGGRKAKAISIADNIGYAIGVDITAHHVIFVLVNLKGQIVKSRRLRFVYRDEVSYYEDMAEQMHTFIAESGIDATLIIGVGISLPGIVDVNERLLLRSHALGVDNVSFKNLERLIRYPYEIENDANSAALAEFMRRNKNSIYFSLSDTVGGAIYIDGQMFIGDNFKSGEFGHIVVERNGRKCYCGKNGCIDAYCSTKLLKHVADDNLDEFFRKLHCGDEVCRRVWEEYLDWLALSITNLRMAFDCDIVLGGYLGGYMEEYISELSQHIKKYNNFDVDISYIYVGIYKHEASAYGATLRFINRFFESL